jgi:uncharacterized repeat protein (TIGR01451 family)
MFQTMAKYSGKAAGFALLPLVAIALLVTPNTFSSAKAETCTNAPTVPTFNPYPVSMQDGNSCNDFPLIRMKVIGGQYPQTIQEAKDGITAHAGDTMYATIWIHNGADPTLPDSQVTAKNVRLLTQVSEGNGSEQTVKAYVTADNAPVVMSQTYNVHIGSNDHLEVVPNSGERFDHLGQLMESGFSVGNQEVSLHDQQACFDHAMFIRFQIKVVGNYTPPVNKGNIVITKQVRNITQGTSFSKSTNARSGDTVEYQIYVNVNSGNVTNATYSDTLPSGFNLNTSSVRINGNSVSSSQATFANLGNMSQGQSATITFQGTVSGYNNTLTNTACAVGDNVQQSCDNATVYVQTIYNPGTSNVVQSKKAWNDTKNQDAQSVNATREDYITYTLTVTNTGTANADNYVIQDDLSGVLLFADMVDNGGGSLNGNTLVYNGVTILVNGSVSKTFKVRVKYNLPANLSYQLVNTYGNTVRINIVGTQVTGPIIAPKTGVDTHTAAGFGGIITLAAAMVIKRKTVLGFILNK